MVQGLAYAHIDVAHSYNSQIRARFHLLWYARWLMTAIITVIFPNHPFIITSILVLTAFVFVILSVLTCPLFRGIRGVFIIIQELICLTFYSCFWALYYDRREGFTVLNMNQSTRDMICTVIVVCFFLMCFIEFWLCIVGMVFTEYIIPNDVDHDDFRYEIPDMSSSEHDFASKMTVEMTKKQERIGVLKYRSGEADLEEEREGIFFDNGESAERLNKGLEKDAKDFKFKGTL